MPLTVTNIGVFGVNGGTPILNPGEAAISCFARFVASRGNTRGLRDGARQLEDPNEMILD
jgi:pyruvate/2-oxoglutarate dehydrogenase complex dihydrolipoamide acyltransferase (E2) component